MKSEKKGLRLYTIYGGILGRTVNGVIRTVLGKLLGLLWTRRRRQPQADDQNANIMASPEIEMQLQPGLYVSMKLVTT